MSGPVQSVERAAAMLEILASQDEPLPLVQIATALDLPKGTVHGLIRTLVALGYVDQQPQTGRYLLGARLVSMGGSIWDENEIKAHCLNWADCLAARTREAVRVGVLRDGEVLLAHHVFRADLSPQTVQTGTQLPLHADELGKVLLAYDPMASRRLKGRPLTRFTFRTITDPVALARALADVRDRGWASAIEEITPDRAGIAAPIRVRGGQVVAAIGVHGHTDSVCDALGWPRPALVHAVRRAARAISHDLGHGRSI